VRQLDIKLLNVIDARCNHEEYEQIFTSNRTFYFKIPVPEFIEIRFTRKLQTERHLIMRSFYALRNSL